MPGLEFRYVGKDSLPTRLSEFDVEYYFALTDSDLAAINQKFRRDGRAGAAIQLVFLRASGHTLDQLNTLPRQLLRYIGEKLGVPTPTIASLRTIYQRYKTLYEHQVWACEYLGLTRLDEDQWKGLEAWLRQDAAESLSLEEMLQHAHYRLYERRILIPSIRALQDLAVARPALEVYRRRAVGGTSAARRSGPEGSIRAQAGPIQPSRTAPLRRRRMTSRAGCG